MAEVLPEHHHPRCPHRTLIKPIWSKCECADYGWDPALVALVPVPERLKRRRTNG